MASIHEVENSPVAFIAGVHVSWRKRWHKIGTKPLQENLQKPVSFFKSDILTRRLSISLSFRAIGTKKNNEPLLSRNVRAWIRWDPGILSRWRNGWS